MIIEYNNRKPPDAFAREVLFVIYLLIAFAVSVCSRYRFVR